MSDDLDNCLLLVQRLEESLNLSAQQSYEFRQNLDSLRTVWSDSAIRRIDQQFLSPIAEGDAKANSAQVAHHRLLEQGVRNMAEADSFGREILGHSEQVRPLIENGIWKRRDAEAEFEHARAAESAALQEMQQVKSLLARI